MGWSEKRVERYSHGQKASWLELRALEYANPIHLAMAILGTVVFVCGLWVHSFVWIVIGVLLNMGGHWYCMQEK